MKMKLCGCKRPPTLSNDGAAFWYECPHCNAIGDIAIIRHTTGPDWHNQQRKDASERAAEYWNSGKIKFLQDQVFWKQGEPWGNALDGRWLLVFFHVDFKLGAPRIVRWGNFYHPPRESRDAWFDDHGREVGLKPIKWAMIDFDLPPKEKK